MKAKLTLAIAIVAVLSLIALPVLAGDDILMWVSRVRLAYNGRSSTGDDMVSAIAHIRDENLSSVSGALVSGTWTVVDAYGTVSTYWDSALTSFQGYAKVYLWAGRGAYTFCVDSVVKDGWLYEPSLNLQTCGTVVVP